VSNLLDHFLSRNSLSKTPAATRAEIREFETRHIGAELEALRRELGARGRELQSAKLLRGSSFVDETLQLMERLNCRIGVIGQVKAGKSSLINSIVRKPRLLPADVNPWTTAVTQLHFGRADAPANVAAEFTFFEPNEWERLAQGGGHIRELTQRLVPGFEVELLQRHLDAMRYRSEERLGAKLGQVLGKKHAFPTLSAEVLERYVCSGLPDAGAEQKGIYSDVVKTADLYFANNHFGFPTTIIDTPGTNDPFLVRDEITRRTLESADVYVVILTARQALSSADVALLRILRGLHKERIAVFINRIDELGDVARDTAAIVQHVRDGLRREFPASEIPIAAGSAFWAEMALSGPQADIDRMLSGKAKAYAQHLINQATASIDLKQGGPSGLFQCSGLPALIDLLSRLSLGSHAGRVLTQISRSFSELARVGQNAARHEVAVLEAEGKSGVAQRREGEEELRAIDAEVQENERLTVALHTLLHDLQTRTDRLIDDHCAKIVESLRDAVLGFADVECENLRRSVADGHRGRVWRCDATLLRQRLEERFVVVYRNAEHEIGALESHIFPKLKQLLNHYRPEWREPDRGEGTDLPVLSALSEVVALDLDEPWWKHWWTRGRDAEGRVAELERLIELEAFPIVDALAQAARKQLKARQASTLQEANLVYLGLADLLKEQNNGRLQHARALAAGGDTMRNSQLHRKWEVRAAELRKHISHMDQLVRRLESVEQKWAEGFS